MKIIYREPGDTNEVQCTRCGNIVKRPTSHRKNNKNGIFCSKSCANKYRNENNLHSSGRGKIELIPILKKRIKSENIEIPTELIKRLDTL